MSIATTARPAAACARLPWLVPLLALSLAAPLRAQTPAPAPAAPGPRPHAQVAGVMRGERVRVWVGGRVADGRAEGTAGDSLVLRVPGHAPVRVAASSIDSLFVRDGRAVNRGVLIGAGVGGATLAGLSLLAGAALCGSSSECGEDTVAYSGLAGLLGAAVGGGLGALIGAYVPAWRRAHP